MTFVCILRINFLTNLSILPRSSKVELSSSFKLLLSFNGRVKDPFSLGKRDVGSHGFSSLIESFKFLFCKLSVQHLEMIAKLKVIYLSDRRLLMKRLLLR